MLGCVKRGIVFIAEDDDGIGLLSGLFSAHWEPDGPDGLEDGPQAVSAEEAIAWGRTRADVVLIRVGEEGYRSAGVRQPASGNLPEWPAAGLELSRRRAPSLAYLDRTEHDPPIAWEVRLSVRLEVRTPQSFAERLADAIRGEPGVAAVSLALDDDLWRSGLGVEGPGPEVGVRFHLQASTCEEAMRLGRAVGGRAVHIAWSLIGGRPGPSKWGMGVSAMPADTGAPSAG